MKIYLATGNLHKKEEFAQIIPNYTIITPQERGIAFNPQETGSTFFENALLKAKELYDLVKEPVIADDSGLCVEALDGRPGIFSARYGSDTHKIVTDTERNTFLLQEMKNIKNRTCHFVCCIVLYREYNNFDCVQETFEGEIITSPRGTRGFGYDPIVYIPKLNKTVAELTSEEKNLFSHRGKAAVRLARLL